MAIYIYIYIYIYGEVVDCGNKMIKISGKLDKWCNGYHRREWTRVQILDETDCISHSTNTLGKGMNLIILPPAMGK